MSFASLSINLPLTFIFWPKHKTHFPPKSGRTCWRHEFFKVRLIYQLRVSQNWACSASDCIDGQVFFFFLLRLSTIQHPEAFNHWKSHIVFSFLSAKACVLVGLKTDRCEYKLVEKKIFLSMKKGNEKSFASSQKEWREAQALKNYPTISIAHHRTDWKPLKSAHFASLYVNST